MRRKTNYGDFIFILASRSAGDDLKSKYGKDAPRLYFRAKVLKDIKGNAVIQDIGNVMELTSHGEDSVTVKFFWNHEKEEFMKFAYGN